MASDGRLGSSVANMIFRYGFVGPSEPNATGMLAASKERNGWIFKFSKMLFRSGFKLAIVRCDGF